MDQIKIGKFIANTRKQKNLTQMNLAEQIGVSDKTISKWETGKSLPDLSYITSLCKVLEINVNELLAGEKLSVHNYSEKAEETIMELMKKSEQGKKDTVKQTMLGVLMIVMTIVLLFGVLPEGLSSLLSTSAYFFDLAGIILLVVFAFGLVLLSGKRDRLSILKFLDKVLIPAGAVETLFFTIYSLMQHYSAEIDMANLAVAAQSILYAVCGKLVVAVLLARQEGKH